MIGLGAAIGGSALLSAGSSIIGADRASGAISGASEAAQARMAELRRQARKDYAPYERVGTGAINRLGDIYLNNDLDLGEVTRTTPDYQFRFSEGQRALERSQAARGLLSSGQTGRALTEFGQNMASSAYETYINRLGQLAGIGMGALNSRMGIESGAAAAANTSQMTAGFGNAQIQGNMWEDIANAGNAAVGNYITADLYGRLFPSGGTGGSSRSSSTYAVN